MTDNNIIFKKTILFNDILGVIPSKIEDHDKFFAVQTDLNSINYKKNKDNFVGENFVHKPDILALGCSVTLPVGLPHHLSWPYLISSEQNCTLNVLAYSGASIQKIVHNAVMHIEKYGPPKEVCFLLPSLDRSWIITRAQEPGQKEEQYFLIDYFFSDSIQEFYSQKFSDFIVKKDFLNIKRSISLEYSFQNQIISLFLFFNYCKALGIRSSYFCWNESFDLILAKHTLLNGIAEHKKRLNNNCYWVQGLNLENLDNRYYSNNEDHQKYWLRGVDKPEFHAHPGMYTHINIAERFLGRRLSQQTIDSAPC